MFDENLGKWDTEPFNLGLNPYYKPFNVNYYLIPRINKDILQKHLQHLLEIGVLTILHRYQYGTPIFITPKKEGTVRVITDYHRINHKLVRNLYPLIIIGENMWKLEGFHYATALYIKTGYYTISVLTKSQDMMTIMTEFGKFRYNHLLTGM